MTDNFHGLGIVQHNDRHLSVLYLCRHSSMTDKRHHQIRTCTVLTITRSYTFCSCIHVNSICKSWVLKPKKYQKVSSAVHIILNRHRFLLREMTGCRQNFKKDWVQNALKLGIFIQIENPKKTQARMGIHTPRHYHAFCYKLTAGVVNKIQQLRVAFCTHSAVVRQK